jgi:L-alanine-DL-glutamate epimerase-like enolase superfamily enzyme
LFSPPHVVERAAGFLHSHGVAERVKCVGRDVRAEIPVEADLYLLKGALQQWDDGNAAAILKACRRAMPPHAKLLIIERPLPESASKDAAEVMLDLHMMVINGGRVRTLQEFEALLAQADLAMSKVHPTQSGLSIIEALPA